MKPDPVFLDFESVEPRQLFPGSWVRFVHSEKMTMANWEFEPEVDLPEHQHPHEQISHILSGEFELTIEGKAYRMHGGDTMIIPANLVHSGRSITSCCLVDVFYPVREDYR